MECNRLVFIRTDANTIIATGHMMRCLTIASSLKSLGASVTFLVSDEESGNLCQKLLHDNLLTDKIGVQILGTDFRNMDGELDILTQLIKDNNPSCILVDSYFVTKHYLKQINQICPLVYLDDLVAFDYPVTGIINYDLAPDTSHYQLATTVLTGATYTPLRPQFVNVPYHIKKEPTSILLSTGGTDPFHISLTLLNHIFTNSTCPLSQVTYHVIVGNLNTDKAALQTLAKQYPNILLHENVTDMASVMKQCDVAITAGGTTLYELCSLGIPNICFSMTDNQIGPGKDFHHANATTYIGDIRDNPFFYKELQLALTSLFLSYECRIEKHHNMHRLVDGLGSQRIAAYLYRLNLL